MSSALPKDAKISLKVMMNKEKTKVLFAEADSKSAEIMLSFLVLPLGKIVRVLKERYADEQPVVGSLTTLYTGLTDHLRSDHFWTDGGRKMLLNPRSSFMSGPVKHFRCGDAACEKKISPNVSMYYDSATCDCGKALSRAMGDIAEPGGDGILVEGLHCLVTDDLRLSPCEPGSVIQTLINLGIFVAEGAEELNVILGYNEIVDLLKGSLLSETPLTDVVLRVSNEDNTGFVQDDFPLDKTEVESRMTVTALMQKSTNKLLFVEAKDDFVDFILSFLTIPLGGVESLLKGKTCFKGINNLYNSTTNLIKKKHFITKDGKRRLQEPELPPYYVSKNQIFSLSEQIAPHIYYHESATDFSNRTVEKGFWMRYKDPKGDQGCYARQPKMFMVYDDLTVKPLCVSSISFIRCNMEVPSYDVEQVEVQIGLKEGLSILRASLESTSALTNGLIIPMQRGRSRSNEEHTCFEDTESFSSRLDDAMIHD